MARRRCSNRWRSISISPNKYAPALYPAEPLNEAKAVQWSVWAISEIEPLQMQIVVQKFFTGGSPDQAVIEAATESLVAHCGSRAAPGGFRIPCWQFCVADLNLAGVMLLMKSTGLILVSSQG